jgi:hypothetical protein
MRLSLPAIALSVCVSPFGPAAAAPSGDATRAASTWTVSATVVPTSAAASDAAAATDAAARHAKRTACLKQAKAKKLVGAEKNSFIKDCISAH